MIPCIEISKMMNKWRNRREGRFSLRGRRTDRSKAEPPLETPVPIVRSVSAPVTGLSIQAKESRLRERQTNTVFDGGMDTKRPWRNHEEEDFLNFVTSREKAKNPSPTEMHAFQDEDDIDVALEALKSFEEIGVDRRRDADEIFETESLPDDEIETFFPMDSEAEIEVTLDYYTQMNEAMRNVHSIEEESSSDSEDEETDSDSESESSEENKEEELSNNEPVNVEESSVEVQDVNITNLSKDLDAEFTYVIDDDDASETDPALYDHLYDEESPRSLHQVKQPKAIKPNVNLKAFRKKIAFNVMGPKSTMAEF